jgi:hypothetical protein
MQAAQEDGTITGLRGVRDKDLHKKRNSDWYEFTTTNSFLIASHTFASFRSSGVSTFHHEFETGEKWVLNASDHYSERRPACICDFAEAFGKHFRPS